MAQKTYKGIDVSENNGKVDMQKVKAAGYEFVIIRTGYGKKHTDLQLSNNVQGATKAGLPYGVYHYSYALDAAGAVKEAELVLSLVKGLNLSFPIWFDMEDADSYKAKRMTINKANITAICKAFCEKIRAAGYSVGVYASKYWLETYIDCAQLGKCDYWLAQWASKPTWKGSYSLWQHTDSAKISGCSGSFDGDIAYTSYNAEHTVTGMQQDKSCAGGVSRKVGVSTGLYQNAQLSKLITTLKTGETVTYYGNHCYVDGEKYAYVKASSGQGYVKAADLRVG